MLYVLCHKKSRPTGRKVAAALGVKSRFRTIVPADTLLLRWGNPLQPDMPSLIQPARGIMKAGNKLIALTCMKNAGVLVPEFTQQQPDRNIGTWFGRSAHGMGGGDIIVQPQGMITYGFAESEFWTKHVPNTREYRIHVFGNRVLGVMGKYLDFPEQVGTGYIKNYAHGYRFRTPPQELKPDRHDAAIAAVNALGLDFGAVDLLVGEDGRAYVLEVNTAPALAPLTARKYIQAIKDMAADKGVEVNLNERAMEAFNVA